MGYIFFNCFSFRHFSCKIEYFVNGVPVSLKRRYLKYKPTKFFNGLPSFFWILSWASIHQKPLANWVTGTDKCFWETTSNNIGEFLSINCIFIFFTKENTRVVCNDHYDIGIDWSHLFAFSSAPRMESFLFLTPDSGFWSTCLVQMVGFKLETCTI